MSFFIVFYRYMKIKQTMLSLAVIFIVFMGLFVNIPQVSAAKCAGVDTSIIDCDDGTSGDSGVNGIYKVLNLGLNILTGGIVIAAIGGIIYGSVLYTTAGGNAEGVKKAKSTIINVVIGLVAYALLYSFMNYLIPGGFLNKTGNINTMNWISVVGEMKI